MQIHELNTFSGIPGETDFLAIDAGYDTAKISVPKLLEPALSRPADEGEEGQLLRNKGNGDTEWSDFGLPTDAQTAQAISDWLAAHPEATTTVQDGSITESKFSNDLKLKTIKEYVTPQMFGAAGDGVTDDTTAFYNALQAGDYLFIPNGEYLIDFHAADLTNKTIRGESTINTILIQKNADIPFAQIGVSTSLTDLSIRMQNNTMDTACLIFGNYSGTFKLFSDCHVERVDFTCDTKTIVLHFTMYNRGTVGGIIRDININICKHGIWVDMTGTGWLTSQRFENFNIWRAYVSAVKITDANRTGQHSQSIYSNISVMNVIEDAIAFDIGPCAVMFLNPACFIENSSGTTYSLRIDKNLAWRQNTASFFYPLIVGGMLEGEIINKEYINLINVKDCIFNIAKNAQLSPVVNYYDLCKSNIPITREVVSTYETIKTGVQIINGTITEGEDEFGKYLELTRTNESQAMSFIFNVGSNASLGSKVTNYPLSTFTSLIATNFSPFSYMTQIYDTGLGNYNSFPTIFNRVDAPQINPDDRFVCSRTLIDDWTEHATYKLHNMQINMFASAPAGSKIRVYKYIVEFDLTRPITSINK